MEKTPPQTSGMRPPIAENSCQLAALPAFSALLGGIPRKEVGQRGSNPGVECGETPLFRGVECGEKLRMQRRGLRIVHFLGIPLLFSNGFTALCQQLDAHKQAVLPTCCTLSNYGWGKYRPAIS
jgi:hypothetical protein